MPAVGVEVQDPAGLDREVPVTWEDSRGLVLPRPDRVRGGAARSWCPRSTRRPCSSRRGEGGAVPAGRLRPEAAVQHASASTASRRLGENRQRPILHSPPARPGAIRRTASPVRHHLSRGLEPCSDLVVVQLLGGYQQDPDPDHLRTRGDAGVRASSSARSAPDIAAGARSTARATAVHNARCCTNTVSGWPWSLPHLH